MQRRIAAVFTLVVCMVPVLLFQNCTIRARFSSESQTQANLTGNGNGYGGKPTYFEYSDPSHLCSTLNSLGRPFPNRMIFATSTGVYLVRDNCQDLEPIEIPSNEYSVDPSSQFITYRGQQFNVKADLSEYNMIPPQCPGTRVYNGAITPNLLINPLDLTAAPWEIEPSSPVSLFGSIEALPRFRIEHAPPFLESWRRVKQGLTINANTDYASTFLISRGNTDHASFTYWVDDGAGGIRYGFDIVISMITGLVTYSNAAFAAPGVTNISIKTQSYGSGLAITVFFRQATTERGTVGISGSDSTPAPVPAGTFIYATAAEVKRVDDFCLP